MNPLITWGLIKDYDTYPILRVALNKTTFNFFDLTVLT